MPSVAVLLTPAPCVELWHRPLPETPPSPQGQQICPLISVLQAQLVLMLEMLATLLQSQVGTRCNVGHQAEVVSRLNRLAALAVEKLCRVLAVKVLAQLPRALGLLHLFQRGHEVV